MAESNLETRRVVILGSSASGKTSLVNRAVHNSFAHDYCQTFGADLTVKTVIDGQKRVLHMWTCGGHERYRPLLEQFCIDVHAALICCDLLSMLSFQELSYWFNEIKRLSPDAIILLVGTKSDETDSMAVKVQDLMKVAQEWGVDFKAVSAKTGAGVNELFDLVVQTVS
ncbi:P-loop containing nucleoside triphosphate hydrolase protein [Polychytrium aggregatum]|uniref:P-loop containing nucleoside triphosphate hydrolase protein n=1 Tax=Polychytrium aggregatum TaxID=110093 RepID=UPI0022FE5CBB|nr:P-loop containing nucleoside triphosphate hydrolase protein [Polychytrium aggregatum]KAI9202084.1 P-loop containing nucleoside triphosphate hydrolase protein [Polychytrium aggregatum]